MINADEMKRLMGEAQITEPLCVDYKELGAEDNRRLFAFLMEGDAEDGAIVCVDEEPVGRDSPSPRLELIAAAVNALPELLALAEENARLNRAVSEISLGVQSGVDLQTSIDRLVKIARDASKPVVDNEAPSTERAALKEPGQ